MGDSVVRSWKEMEDVALQLVKSISGANASTGPNPLLSSLRSRLNTVGSDGPSLPLFDGAKGFYSHWEKLTIYRWEVMVAGSGRMHVAL